MNICSKFTIFRSLKVTLQNFGNLCTCSINYSTRTQPSVITSSLIIEIAAFECSAWFICCINCKILTKFINIPVCQSFFFIFIFILLTCKEASKTLYIKRRLNNYLSPDLLLEMPRYCSPVNTVSFPRLSRVGFEWRLY